MRDLRVVSVSFPTSPSLPLSPFLPFSLSALQCCSCCSFNNSKCSCFFTLLVPAHLVARQPACLLWPSTRAHYVYAMFDITYTQQGKFNSAVGCSCGKRILSTLQDIWLPSLLHSLSLSCSLCLSIIQQFCCKCRSCCGSNKTV